MNRINFAHRFVFAAVLALLVVLPVHAMLPENGWYWNPSESGRGFNLEIQDNALFFSAFVYRPDGSAAWYVGGGPMSSDRAWHADLYETTDGQCIGCAYRPATLLPSGTVSISFTSERSAVILLPGGTVSVVRQDWSNSGTASRDALFGEWSMVEGDPSFPVYYAERVSLYLPRSDASGTYAGGYVTGGTNHVAVGTYSSNGGAFAILVDSSSSYYSLYLFPMNTFNRVEGLEWTYLKSGTPTGNGTYFLAHRTKSYTRVRGLNGPGVSKVAVAGPGRDAIDSARASRSADKSGEAIEMEGLTLDFVRETARGLQAQLEGMQR